MSPVVVSLRRCPPANRRLASPTNLPALPGEPNSDSLAAAFSGCAFRLTFDLRLRSAFQFRLPTFSSACASDRSSGYLPSFHRLAPLF